MIEGPRLLVIGRNGQVARALAERAGERRVPLLALGREECDLATFTDLPDAADDFEPTAIINAAAYTAVDKAEDEREAAFAVNAAGPGRLAEAAARRGLPLMHISTDYVYDGGKSAPYVESDPTAPLGVYGASKLAGEKAVRVALPDALIFRTAWVYSPFGGNFVKTMLRLGAERDSLRVVDDQIGSPTSALDIADALISVAADIYENDLGNRAGIYHLAGSGETSWCGLARAIFQIAGARGGPSIPVEAIPTSEYPTPAKRPANSRLDGSKLEKAFGIRLPDWRQSLKPVVARLLAKG